MLIVDTDPTVVQAAIDEGYFDVADPLDLEVQVDSCFNDYSMLYEGLGKTAVKAKRVAVRLFTEVACAWRERIRRDFPNQTWTIYIQDEKSDPAFPGFDENVNLHWPHRGHVKWPHLPGIISP